MLSRLEDHRLRLVGDQDSEVHQFLDQAGLDFDPEVFGNRLNDVAARTTVKVMKDIHEHTGQLDRV